jgi:uncharacterized membrane protein (UPF0127 family)
MRTLIKVIVAFFIVMAAAVGYLQLARRLAYDERAVRRETGAVFAERAVIRIPDVSYTASAEVARSPEELKQGLSGRRSLAPTAGLLLVFNQPDYHGIWMSGMRFSIDVIWISGGAVVDTSERLPVPKRGEVYIPIFRPSAQALLALEVPAGTVSNHKIKKGQRVEVQFDGE